MLLDALYEPIEIAKNIYWVGSKLENDPFQCLPYLIVNGDESILLDPGSMFEFDELVRKIKTLIDIKDIKYIILHHQDPDLAACVPTLEKLICRDDLQIVTHSRMSLLIKHYMVTSSYYEIDKNDLILKGKNGLRLEFHTTPYCHSPGAFVSYEPNTKTLFSGDIFGGIEHSWQLYADESYFYKAKLFHEEYMPSKDIFNYSLQKIQKLDLNIIAPQHGSIIKKEYIPKLIEDMKSLDCGLYIDKKYNDELLDIIDKLKEKEKTIQEQNIILMEQSKRAEMGEMMQNVAHQWRQPLSIVSTTLSILKEMLLSDEQSQEIVLAKYEKMQQKISYMSQTLEDFLNYYKPDKEKNFFNIYKTIQKSFDIVGVLSNKENISINYDDVDTSLEYFGSQNELIQVVVTLLTNINDQISIRKIKDVVINIVIKKGYNSIIISIGDNCGGIEEQNLSKIFDPYFTTKHQFMGIGLGLYMAKRIVQVSFKGELRATNIYTNDGIISGANFSIELRDEE